MYSFAAAYVWCMRLFGINKKPGKAFILTGFVPALKCLSALHYRPRSFIWKYDCLKIQIKGTDAGKNIIAICSCIAVDLYLFSDCHSWDILLNWVQQKTPLVAGLQYGQLVLVLANLQLLTPR